MGKVVVGLNSDSSVSSLKGPTRPVFTERDRKFMLESCRYVDEVRIFEEDTPYNLIKVVKPDIIVKGSDYEIEDVVGNDLCKSVILFNYVDGYSTTQIIKNLSDR